MPTFIATIATISMGHVILKIDCLRLLVVVYKLVYNSVNVVLLVKCCMCIYQHSLSLVLI